MIANPARAQLTRKNKASSRVSFGCPVPRQSAHHSPHPGGTSYLINSFPNGDTRVLKKLNITVHIYGILRTIYDPSVNVYRRIQRNCGRLARFVFLRSDSAAAAGATTLLLLQRFSLSYVSFTFRYSTWQNQQQLHTVPSSY